MGIITLLVCALATWRISNVLVKEEGPFKIFEKIRASKYHLGLLDCIFCTSVWIAAMVIPWFIGFTPLPRYIIHVFAVSGLSMMLMTYSGVNHG